jgi:hypothetical protein
MAEKNDLTAKARLAQINIMSDQILDSLFSISKKLDCELQSSQQWQNLHQFSEDKAKELGAIRALHLARRLVVEEILRVQEHNKK